MITAIDYSDVYKFRSSVGLWLLTIAAALPWLVGQLFSVGVRGIGDDTAAARFEMWTRVLIDAGPWLQGSLALIAVLLLLSGLIPWSQLQRKRDEAEERRAKREGLEVSALERQAVQQKQRREASGANPDDEPADRYEVDVARMEAVARNELRTARLVRRAFGSRFDVHEQSRMELDGLFAQADVVVRGRESKDASFVVEARSGAVSDYAAFLDRAFVYVARAAAMLEPGRLPTGRRGRPPTSVATGVLLWFYSGQLTATTVEAIQRKLRGLNFSFQRKVGLVMVSGDDAARLSEGDLEGAIYRALSDPNHLVHVAKRSEQ